METASPSFALQLQAIGIANGYSYDLANDRRKPSVKLALRIFRETGRKLGKLEGLTDDEIAVLAKAHG
jgi:hypothetical protein